MKLDADNLADAFLLHGHPIEHVGHGDGALVVGDDDELRVGEEALQHTHKLVDIGFVERGVQFVQNAEGAGPDLID